MSVVNGIRTYARLVRDRIYGTALFSKFFHFYIDPLSSLLVKWSLRELTWREDIKVHILERPFLPWLR